MKRVYYSIKDVSAMVNEPESTLRYWEDEFPEAINPYRKDRDGGVKKPSMKERKENKSSLGNRFYSEEDVDNVRMVQYLIRNCHLTFEGVHLRLKDNKESAEKQAQLLFRLKNIRANLKEMEEAIKEVEKSQELS